MQSIYSVMIVQYTLAAIFTITIRSSNLLPYNQVSVWVYLWVMYHSEIGNARNKIWELEEEIVHFWTLALVLLKGPRHEADLNIYIPIAEAQ